MSTMFSRFRQYCVNRKGQGMVEYGLILGLVALVVVLALVALGSGVSGWFSIFATAVNAASGGG